MGTSTVAPVCINGADGESRRWWKEAVVYQIYPASYMDSNGDGIGDIQGIISRLDYVKSLEVDVVWLSPHYKSPQIDMGYDISDYNDVYAPYGNMDDCETLIKEIHSRGMRVIFDLVTNHTSNQHAWFQASRSSKTDPKRDWYIWRPAKYDSEGRRMPPNNWRSYFTVPAWTWDEATEEYYLHLFADEQPDLNWENEECRRAIYDSAIKFWLDKGVDGFRIDTINIYSKTYAFNEKTGIWDLPDAPNTDSNTDTVFAPMMFCNGPNMKKYLNEMNDIFDRYDVMTVGELQCTTDPKFVSEYVSAANRQINMVFNFEAVQLGQSPGAIFDKNEYTLADFKNELTKWQNLVESPDGWATVFLENHDHPRSISRFGSDAPEHREQSGKMLAMVLASLSGTLFLYQGQEIGMINAPESWGSEEYKDVMAVNYYDEVKSRSGNDPKALSDAMKRMQIMARDHARVPMQWDDSPNAGFSKPGSTPWMSVVDSYREINVQEQRGRSTSLLHFWTQLLQLRREHRDLFVYGIFRRLEIGDDLLVFTKSHGSQMSLTVANLTSRRVSWKFPAIDGIDFARIRPLIQNAGTDNTSLEPFEARIYLLSPST